MANIAVVAFKIGKASLSLGANEYSDAISSAEIASSPSVSTFKGINGKQKALAGASSFMLNLTLAQDHITATALATKLWNDAGTTSTFELTPQAGGAKFTGSVVLVEPSVGGAVDSDAVTTVSLLCEGKPVRTTV